MRPEVQADPICVGCRRPIERYRETPTIDPSGRPWHAGCLSHQPTTRVSRARRQATGFDYFLWLFCWPWALARLLGRHQHWKPWQENIVGIAAAVTVFLVTALTIGVISERGTTSATAPVPTTQAPRPASAGASLSDIETALRPDLQRWLTGHSPAGIAARVAAVHCQGLGAHQFKCIARGMLGPTDDQRQGHMTVLVTVAGDRYRWEMVEGWTQD